MTKFIGGVVVGIFLGALTLEVLARTNPELLERAESKARRAAERVGDIINARKNARAFASGRPGPSGGEPF